VLVLDEFIVEVDSWVSSPTSPHWFGTEWNPVLLEDYYLSPGLVDCNAQVNGSWDDFASLTRTAVSGGVAFLLTQPSLYNQDTPPLSSLYCDIGCVALFGRSSLEEVQVEAQGAFALKAYLSRQDKSQALPRPSAS